MTTREEAIEKVAEELADEFFWPKMSEDLRAYYRERSRGLFDSLGLTVALPPGEDESDDEPGDAEQALARLHGTRVVGVDTEDERAVDAAVARATAGATSRPLRQPPPSPSREEAVERLARALWWCDEPGASFWHGLVESTDEIPDGDAESWREQARAVIRTLGLVAASPSRDIYTVEVPRALVERVRTARTLIVDANNKCVRCAGPPTIFYEYLDGPCRTGCATCERVAAGELADAVLSQLGAKMTT